MQAVRGQQESCQLASRTIEHLEVGTTGQHQALRIIWARWRSNRTEMGGATAAALSIGANCCGGQDDGAPASLTSSIHIKQLRDKYVSRIGVADLGRRLPAKFAAAVVLRPEAQKGALHPTAA